MHYRTLTSEALADLRLERLRALEIEHARHVIRLEDAADEPERAEIRASLDDLERRHTVHVAYADVPDEQAAAADGESDDPDETGEPEPEPTAPMTEPMTEPLTAEG